MASETFLLKIITGPNQGAEIAIEEESLTVGTSSECDLILSDSLVNPKHLSIQVEANKITLQPLNGAPVYAGGEPIGKESFALEPFQFVCIGTTNLIIGPSNTQWPILTAADVPELRKKTPSEEETEGQDNEDQEEQLSDTTTTPEGALATKNVSPETTKFSKKQKFVLSLLSSCTILLVIALIFIAFNFDGKQTQNPLSQNNLKPELPLIEKIKEELTQANLGENFNIYSVGETVHIKAWVEKNADKTTVETLLEPFQNKVDLEIWSQEQTLASLTEMVNEWNFPISIESLEPGKVRLHGYFGDAQAWKRLIAQIKRDVPGIKSIQNDVITAEKAKSIGKQIFLAYDLADKVSIAPLNQQIVLKGFIVEALAERLSQAIQDFKAQLNYIVPINNQVLIAQAEKIYFDLDIDSVTIGAQGVITTKNGDRYFEGGVLKDGFIVEKISRNGIILKKGDQTITINVGEDYVRKTN